MSSVPSALTFDEFYAEAFYKGTRHLYRSYDFTFSDAEEIVQHTLVEFWQAHPDVATMENPVALFFGYLRVMVLQVQRQGTLRPVTLSMEPFSRAHRERPVSLDRSVGINQNVAFGETLPIIGPSVETIVMARLQWQEVSAGINQLPLDKRRMFYLLLLGYDLHEIPAQLEQRFGCSRTYSAVHSVFSKVRKTLRQQAQLVKAQRRFKKAAAGKPWSPNFPACRHCGTTTIAHHGRGYCYACASKMRALEVRQGQRVLRKKGNWAFEHVACIACATTAVPHQGRGYCRVCYWRLFGEPHKVAATRSTKSSDGCSITG